MIQIKMLKKSKMSERVKLNINKESDHTKIKKNLQDYVHIQDRHYSLIPVFTRIRYIDRENDDFFYGGIIISNKSPKTISIRGIGYNKTWSIFPEKYTIFIEDHSVRKSIKVEKNNLYQLFCDCKIKLNFNEE